jgi:hypothetical protein
MTIAGPAADAVRAVPVPESLDEGPAVDIGPDEVVARAARNIATWGSYLPADCVAAMIAMGWDEST